MGLLVTMPQISFIPISTCKSETMEEQALTTICVTKARLEKMKKDSSNFYLHFQHVF